VQILALSYAVEHILVVQNYERKIIILIYDILQKLLKF